MGSHKPTSWLWGSAVREPGAAVCHQATPSEARPATVLEIRALSRLQVRGRPHPRTSHGSVGGAAIPVVGPVTCDTLDRLAVVGVALEVNRCYNYIAFWYDSKRYLGAKLILFMCLSLGYTGHLWFMQAVNLVAITTFLGKYPGV